MTPEQPFSPKTKENHAGNLDPKMGGERPVKDFRSKSTNRTIPLEKAIERGYLEKLPTGEVTLDSEADRFIALPSNANTTPTYPEYEPRGSIDTSEELDLEEIDEDPARKSKLKKALFYAGTSAALVATLLVGAKVVADKNDKPSELDMWNKSSPVATAPLITPAPQETTETIAPKDEVIGTNSDLKLMDVMNIISGFYQNSSFGEFEAALTDISQSDLDTIRLVVAGHENPAELDKILQKHGLSEATSWGDANL